jgi:hypothetical protein
VKLRCSFFVGQCEDQPVVFFPFVQGSFVSARFRALSGMPSPEPFPSRRLMFLKHFAARRVMFSKSLAAGRLMLSEVFPPVF